MSAARPDLVAKLQELGIAENTAKYALSVSTSVSPLNVQKTNGDLERAANYGECQEPKGPPLLCPLLLSMPCPPLLIYTCTC